MYHSDNGLSTYGARKHLGTLWFLRHYTMNLKFLTGKKKKESTKKRKMREQGDQYLTSYLDCNILLIDSYSCKQVTTMGQKSF